MEIDDDVESVSDKLKSIDSHVWLFENSIHIL